MRPFVQADIRKMRELPIRLRSGRREQASWEARGPRAPAYEAAACPLRREAPARSPGPLDAFKLARRQWLASERVEMSALARELGVNRVTLYRWVGSREQLLVEVIWQLAEQALRILDEQAERTGADRIVHSASGLVEVAIENPGMRHWLAQEGEAAMRLLTLRESGYQERLVGWFERLLAEEADAGHLELDAEVRDVAYAIVRLMESYVYTDLITGEEPEPGHAEPILRMLLR
jgi:AcrR family transcriptional regulator